MKNAMTIVTSLISLGLVLYGTQDAFKRNKFVATLLLILIILLFALDS
jgi:hypothetical protein